MGGGIRNNEITFSDFLLKRMKSIYPIYLFGEITCLGVLIYRQGIRAFTFQDFLFDIMMVRTGWLYDDWTYNAVGWLACILVLCYILFFVLCRISVRFDVNIIYLVILMIVVGCCLQNRPLNLPFLYGHNGDGLFNFFVGGLLALLVDMRKFISSREATLILCGFAIVWLLFEKVLGCADFMGRSHIIFTLFLLPLVFMSATNGVIKMVSGLLSPLGIISKQLCFLHMPVYLIFRIIFPSNYILGPGTSYALYFFTLMVVCLTVYYLEKLLFKRIA